MKEKERTSRHVTTPARNCLAAARGKNQAKAKRKCKSPKRRKKHRPSPTQRHTYTHHRPGRRSAPFQILGLLFLSVLLPLAEVLLHYFPSLVLEIHGAKLVRLALLERRSFSTLLDGREKREKRETSTPLAPKRGGERRPKNATRPDKGKGSAPAQRGAGSARARRAGRWGA